MRIGILVTGHVPAELEPRHGTYAQMFADLLGAAAPDFSFPAWNAVDGVMPEGVAAADAWLVTGSKHGVYDDLPWIAPLRRFLADARAASRPIVGVCFGHQILAEALGGRAEKSGRGWGIGRSRYEVLARPSWMADAPGEIAIHAMHQDQVTALPPDARLLAANAHCPLAMLAYGNPERPDAISIQPHPEFDADYTRALIERRIGTLYPEPLARDALAELGGPTDAPAFARWCVAYLRRVGADARAA